MPPLISDMTLRVGARAVAAAYFRGQSLLNSVLSGVQLFLIDSLTGGAGNIKAPPFYIAKTALDAGRLSSIFVRAVPATTATSDTIVSMGASMSNTLGDFAPYAPGFGVSIGSGVGLSEELNFSTYTFPWQTADIYYLKSPTGGTFDVTSPATLSDVDTSGTLGAIGRATITNPNGLALTTIKLSGFTGQCCIVGVNFRLQDHASNKLAVVNFGVASKTSADYLTITNIADWYDELGVDGAVLNLGMNDGAVARPTVRSQFNSIISTLTATGVALDRMLLVRPNDGARALDGVWESLATDTSIPFASIMRIWGNLAEFQSNNWMAAADTVHPNNTWNEIYAAALYQKALPAMHSAVEVGVHRWYTEFAASTFVLLDSDVSITGDFKVTSKFRFVSGRSALIFCNGANFDHQMIVNSSGQARMVCAGVNLISAAGAVTAGWHIAEFERVGTTGTIKIDGVTVISGTTGAGAFVGRRIGASSGAMSIQGCIHSVSVDAATDHSWNLDQDKDTSTVTATAGGVNGAWQSRQTGPTYVTQYAVLDGVLTNVFDPRTTFGTVPNGW